jgi:hypothetical protein
VREMNKDAPASAIAKVLVQMWTLLPEEKRAKFETKAAALAAKDKEEKAAQLKAKRMEAKKAKVKPNPRPLIPNPKP